MAYPEKTRRNEKIYYQHLTGRSYRAIQRSVRLKSVKNVYRIVARMRGRHKDAAGFLAGYKKLSTG